MATAEKDWRIALLKWFILVSIASFCVQPCLSITDSMNGNWSQKTVTLRDTSEADLMVRTGDIDNLNFGWPADFDPFSGQSTPAHSYPWAIDPKDPKGTDRIMVVSSYNNSPPHGSEGYTGTTSRPDNLPQAIDLSFDASNIDINSAVLQMFVDDFQAPVFGTKYQVKLNGVRVPEIEEVINSLDQTGPIGKMISVKIPGEYLNPLKNGRLSISIDDPETGAGDGFAIDFVKLLINPKQLARSGTVEGKVLDGTTNQPIEGVMVTAGGIGEAHTDGSGQYTLTKVPAGLASLKAQKAGYDSQIKNIDVIADKTATLDFSLNPHPESESQPIMTPTPQQIQQWVSFYKSAPNAEGTVSSASEEPPLAESKGESFSLLPYLQYTPDERNQGGCGDCWQWAGTAVMEIQLAYRKDIKDRLSVQYLNSNIAGQQEAGEPCCGDWLDTVTKFYTNSGKAIPWSNSNAGWMDGRSTCEGGSAVLPSSISTSPAYSIVSIRTEKVPTQGVGKETAISNIKSVLHQGKAVWFAFFIPNRNGWDAFHSFWNNQQESAIFKFNEPSGTLYDKEGGGHATVIVGYDETDPNNRNWIVLNSWGESSNRPNVLFRVSMDMDYDSQYPTSFTPNTLNAFYFQTLDVTYADQGNQNKINLTGVWACDDGGTYYLRQLGNVLWWDGDDPNDVWANVAQGTIDGNTVTMEYSDVPEGSATGLGKLVLDIVSNNELKAREKPESYGGSHWTRSSKSQPPEPKPNPQPNTDPWNDPSVRSLIDEWIRQQDNCVKEVYPGAYIDKWGRICGETDTATISCTIAPDHPADWDSYHYLWANNWCPNYYPYTVQDYVSMRQSGSSFDDLAECKTAEETCY